MSNETATLVKLSAAEQAAAVKKGDVTSRELVEAHLKVIEAAEPSIKAFLKFPAMWLSSRPTPSTPSPPKTRPPCLSWLVCRSPSRT